jgi:hypothetical protein
MVRGTFCYTLLEMVRSLLVLLVFTSLDAAAQSSGAPSMSRPDVSLRPGAIETPHVTVTASASPAVAAPGARVSLFLNIVPKPKMHVYSPRQENYIPVSVTLEPNKAFRAQEPVFPKAEKYFFAPLKETQLVYSKSFRIVQPVTLASLPVLRDLGRQPGTTLTIAGTLRYQACDDAICYLPKTLPVSWRIELKPSAMQ